MGMIASGACHPNDQAEARLPVSAGLGDTKNMIAVSNEIPVYEISGTETKDPRQKLLRVESHWNRHQMVTLSFGECRITVLARDLDAAIQNATNAAH